MEGVSGDQESRFDFCIGRGDRSRNLKRFILVSSFIYSYV
jgi:hypothetical protein